jgi:hypothetical protein
MQRKFVRVATLFLVSQVAWSQAVTGSISGSVTDNSGATIASARLTLVNVGNREQRTVQTNDSGQFTVSSMDPGEYSITVQATGFKTLQRNGVILTPSEILSVGNLVLDLGTVEEKVTVTAQGATFRLPAASVRSPSPRPRRKSCPSTDASSPLSSRSSPA